MRQDSRHLATACHGWQVAYQVAPQGFGGTGVVGDVCVGMQASMAAV